MKPFIIDHKSKSLKELMKIYLMTFLILLSAEISIIFLRE